MTDFFFNLHVTHTKEFVESPDIKLFLKKYGNNINNTSNNRLAIELDKLQLIKVKILFLDEKKYKMCSKDFILF